ncbi:MAG: HEAT repeat domain-containing protein [Verrucomicrobiae bacterium]|nr:HEAT repeat domain-containing protein [Verrucomicrobiae bacterium]
MNAVPSIPGWCRLALGLLWAAPWIHLGAVADHVEPEVSGRQMPRVAPTEPSLAPATFELRPGFRVEPVATEPLVVSPVAVAVDEQARAYVVEMRDYSERRPERLGRIRLLEDPDGDGQYDRATVFLDGLPWPTAITCWDGGVFLGVTPDILYAKDTDGDGIADVREVIFTGFASDYAPYETNRLNVQAMLNSFHWGLDHRIHGATSLSGGSVRLVDSPFTRRWRAAAGGAPSGSEAEGAVNLRGRDFSFDPRNLDLRAETGGGQHGMSFDDAGRKFVCANSDHLQLIAFNAEGRPPNPYVELPPARGSIAVDGPAATVYRRSPDEPWRVLRTRWRVAGLVPGPIEGGGRASGYFTGATGTTVYRGDAYGPDFAGDAFIGDAGGNLVHRKKLRPTTTGWLLAGERASDEQTSEFLASTDNWFRPVQFYNGPDGCLWVLDMYREVIEHPWSIPANLKARLDLDSGRDRGRIWRIVPNGFRARPDRRFVDPSRPADLVALLGDSNGWHRDTAARLLHQLQDPETVLPLRLQAANPTNRLARLHALTVLDGLGGLEVAALRQALEDPDPAVRRQGVRLAFASGERDLMPALANLAADPDPWVQLEVALGLESWPPAARIPPLVTLLQTGPELVRDVAVHAVRDGDGEVFRQLTTGSPAPLAQGEALRSLARAIGIRNDPGAVEAVIATLAARPGDGLAPALVAALGDGLRRAGTELVVADPTGSLDAVFRTALRQAREGTPALRADAVACLAQQPWDRIATEVGGWLASGSPEDQSLGVAAAGRYDLPASSALLVGMLPALSRNAQSEAVRLLLRRPATTRRLLLAAADGHVAASGFQVDQQNALRDHADVEIRELARRLFGEPPESRADVVTRFLPALNHSGDATRGAVLFQERCATCHRHRGEGVELGPDLDSVKSNGPEKLLVSILDPNREVPPQFTAWTAETRSGETYTGLLARESETSVTLRTAGGAETTLSRRDLAVWRPEGRSLMPEGLEADLTPEDLAALLSFLSPP